ncbi:hypothetical protein DPX16_7659 [Anabarilius grahami]|uniref:Uncharacterized protein n=1 Tax=Anabarilius grahami TaxID=495550 RepID=A0A3N0YRA1_ANAGA|nr:hypothetical protein DPX16_7659 [Anabarilius grahami]
MGLAANTGEEVEAVDVEAAAVVNDEDGGLDDDGRRCRRQMTGTLTHTQDGTPGVKETMETMETGACCQQNRHLIQFYSPLAVPAHDRDHYRCDRSIFQFQTICKSSSCDLCSAADDFRKAECALMGVLLLSCSGRPVHARSSGRSARTRNSDILDITQAHTRKKDRKVYEDLEEYFWHRNTSSYVQLVF